MEELAETSRRRYDAAPLKLAAEELDFDSFKRFLSQIGQLEGLESQERLLAHWQIVADGHPTVAGVLLFGANPQRHLPYAHIYAERRAASDNAACPIDRRVLAGQLLSQIEQAEDFVDFEIEPAAELGKAAFREAIVNAVAHRDYTIREPIRLFLFDDRIEIRSPGPPPHGYTAEALRIGVHLPRNPWIYVRLSDAGLVGRPGTGIRRMMHLVREATGRDVEIEVREFEVLVTIPRKL